MVDAASPFETVMRPGLPPPAAGRWSGFPAHNFVGGHNAPEALLPDTLMQALKTAIDREGLDLATYNLRSGPQGYEPLRAFVTGHLAKVAGMRVTADELLVTSGSLQGMDLINAALLQPGDTVLIEEVNYGGVLTRLARLGVEAVPVRVDRSGMCMASLGTELEKLSARGVQPKYIYTIPTVQNPSATVLSEARRREMLALAKQYQTVIFEDDCYADLVFAETRPPAIHALDDDGRVVYLGSFSKSIAPALRVGYVAAPWPLLSQLIALKTDAGTGALEQLMLAEYCPRHFENHIANLLPILKGKLAVLTSALEEHFGTAAEFAEPEGGIFLWVKLPEAVDTTVLAKAGEGIGISVNPGREWSVASDAGQFIRICYANPDHETIRTGVAGLADICFETFGVPKRGGNVERFAGAQ